jgi:hypothetical protein
VIVGYPNIVTMDEYRTNSRGTELGISGASGGFLLTSGFAVLPLFLHPIYQSGSKFRYIGTTSEPKGHLLAFAQVPGMAKIYNEFQYVTSPPAKVKIYIQGLIWVDPASCQVIRMHTEMLTPAPQIGLESSASDLEFGPVVFKGIPQAFWLPREVAITTRYGSKIYRNRHLYSDYKLFTVESYDKVKRPTLPVPPL